MGLMNRTCLLGLSLIGLLQTCVAPPVTKTQQKEEPPQQDSDFGGLEDYMEYHRYLKEVVNALESDPDFRQKLEQAGEAEVRSGKIAEQLQFVSHHVRTRLDELKRVELQRLRELTEKKIKLEQGIDEEHHHVDQSNPHTFEIEDLKKLITKTTQDLAEADKLRKEEFKHYELEKEYQKLEKLNHTNGAEKEQLEKEYREMETKHKNHKKLHEPGHKAQLQEVWEEQDQMQQDFDPKTFFMLHDLDGNRLWDQEEVKALFIKELDKMYQQGAPEDDMRERVEEMERMRESVFGEMDQNRDGFIDFQEFLRQTSSNNFKQDNGWQPLDEQTKPYTDEELAEYYRLHHAANEIPQYQEQVPPGYRQPANQQFHPGQVPQMAPQHLDLNTNEIYPEHPPQYQQNPAVPVNNIGQHQFNQQPNIPPQQQQQYQQAHIPQQQPNVPQQQPNIPQQQQYQHPNIPPQYANIPQQQQQPNIPQQPPNVPQQQQQANIPQQPPNVLQQPNIPLQQQQPNIPQQQQYQQPNVAQRQNIPQQPNVGLNEQGNGRH
ncbi:nucleobindin-2 [Dendroctonus ponderosae]|uniref:nucleobindin-2 n=1 Tax=Dendroctonus ponderosae TaxID=77166 RepID=UPI002034E178|nr:nucleobindin-2 [Dendroctonus ponderosae]XP_019762797.2 nucleobindin-2 [Dendroctonus ponderosae]